MITTDRQTTQFHSFYQTTVGLSLLLHLTHSAHTCAGLAAATDGVQLPDKINTLYFTTLSAVNESTTILSAGGMILTKNKTFTCNLFALKPHTFTSAPRNTPRNTQLPQSDAAQQGSTAHCARSRNVSPSSLWCQSEAILTCCEQYVRCHVTSCSYCDTL